MNKLVEIVRFFDPNVPEENTQNLSGDDWVLHSDLQTRCPFCDGDFLLLVKMNDLGKNSLDIYMSCAVLCPSERYVYRVSDLAIALQDQIDSLCAEYSETSQLFNEFEPYIKKYGFGTRGQQSELPSGNVPVPLGMRQVCWLSKSETIAIAKAYSKEKSIKLTHKPTQEVIFRAVYVGGVPEYAEQCKMYKAQVVALRKVGQAFIRLGWIRPDEAKFLQECAVNGISRDFKHEQFGFGGTIQYFAPDSKVAQGNHGVVRLLRNKRM